MAPTTSYIDTTFGAACIGARTDPSGAAVLDISSEELRMPLAILSEGYLASGAFQVQAQTSPDMTVKIGSGAARVDTYVVSGNTTGQGNYMVRLDSNTTTVTIAPADASQPRTDEVWLLVQDNAYDASARALPRIAYRKGDLGGGNPGPDATWRASVLLARVSVPPGTTSITTGSISDQRAAAGLLPRSVGSDVGTPRTFVLSSVVTAATTTGQQAFNVAIPAAGWYLVEGFLDYLAAPGTDMRLYWNAPAGSSGRWSSGGIFPSNASRIGTLDMGMVPLASALGVSGDAGGPTTEVNCRPTLHLNAAGVGNLGLYVAQNTGSGFATSLRPGSTLRVTRLS